MCFNIKKSSISVDYDNNFVFLNQINKNSRENEIPVEAVAWWQHDFIFFVVVVYDWWQSLGFIFSFLDSSYYSLW